MPNAKRYAFVFKLRNPFNPLRVVGENYSLIAVEGCCHFGLFNRVFSLNLCFNSRGTETLNCQITGVLIEMIIDGVERVCILCVAVLRGMRRKSPLS